MVCQNFADRKIDQLQSENRFWFIWASVHALLSHRDQDVAWLDIPVNDWRSMKKLKSGKELSHDLLDYLWSLLWTQNPFSHYIFQCVRHVLHYNCKVSFVLGITAFVLWWDEIQDLNYVRMTGLRELSHNGDLRCHSLSNLNGMKDILEDLDSNQQWVSDILCKPHLTIWALPYDPDCLVSRLGLQDIWNLGCLFLGVQWPASFLLHFLLCVHLLHKSYL